MKKQMTATLSFLLSVLILLGQEPNFTEKLSCGSKATQDYIRKISKKDIYKKLNLSLIGECMVSSNDKNFTLFSKQAEKVNKVMGKNYSENIVISIITREEIAIRKEGEKTDWNELEQRGTAKYGMLGQECVWGHGTAYYSSINDWIRFGEYYQKYFERAIPNERSFLHINNLSWLIFEHVDDTSVLNTAIMAMEYNLDKFERYNASSIDTYANLLYKVGRRAEALKWEELAVKISDKKESLVNTLLKMKRNEVTWKK